MLPAELVRAELEKILSSSVFAAAGRSARLLRYLVEQTLNGQADRLKEYTLGTEALGRAVSFDPRIDPIARVEVSRLRSRLDQYYGSDGRMDSIAVVIPKGGYVPVFENRPPASVATPAGSRVFRTHPLLPLAAWYWFGAAVLACGLGVFLWKQWPQPPATGRPLMQLDVELRPHGQLGSEVGVDLALSSDGTRLVFAARGEDGVTRLNVRRLDDRLGTVELPGTEGARGHFLSPDGEWVAFWAAGKIKKASLGGSAPIPLCDSSNLMGGSWGSDNNIIATLDSSNRLWRVSASGGRPVPVLDLAQSGHPRWPQVLPGAKAVLFTLVGGLGPDAASINVFSFRDGRSKTLIRGGTYGRYVSSGQIVYLNQGTLFAVPFDLERLEIRGTSVAILQNVSYSSVFGYADFDVARMGTLVYRRSAGTGLTVQWLGRNDNAEPLLMKTARYSWPRLSPDGQRLAFVLPEGGNTNIFIAELQRDRVKPVTVGDGTHMAPLWTPDGRFIVFQGANGVFQVRADGADQPRRLMQTSTVQVPWSFSPDGKRLAFYEMNPSSAFDLWTVPIAAHGDELRAGDPEPFLRTPSFEVYPTFSPDGRWIAYSSNRSGLWEVYVRSFPDLGIEVQISSGGGRIPHWPRKGSEILYETEDQRIVSVAYAIKNGSFSVGKQRIWSDRRLGDTGVLPNFDVAPDGRSLAVLLPAGRPEEQQSPNHITFVLNFLDEMQRRLMPAGK